jgi:hypothetical protein
MPISRRRRPAIPPRVLLEESVNCEKSLKVRLAAART